MPIKNLPIEGEFTTAPKTAVMPTFSMPIRRRFSTSESVFSVELKSAKALKNPVAPSASSGIASVRIFEIVSSGSNITCVVASIPVRAARPLAILGLFTS